jgi:hypothetical protein
MIKVSNAINWGLIGDLQTTKRTQKREMHVHAMTKNVTKGIIVMMMVLAILVQALVKADNSFFSYVSPNHPPSLTPFRHSLPIISLSAYEMDAKPRRINIHSRRKNTPKETEIPGSKITKEEMKCLDDCEAKILKIGRLYVGLLKIIYELCTRKCHRYA